MTPSFSPDTATGYELPQMAMIVRPSDAAWQQELTQAVSTAPPDLSASSHAEQRAKTLATLEHLMHASVVRGDMDAARRYWREIGDLLQGAAG
jgi:hypothetical protein